MTRYPPGVVLGRLLHGAISLVFLACIGIVWWAAISGDPGVLTAIAAGLLVLEGALVLIAGGDCPLGGLWARMGDETPFFELIVGPRLAPHAIPVLAAVATAGIAVVGLRLLL